MATAPPSIAARSRRELSEHDRTELYASGLTDETIEAAEFQTVYDPAAVGRELGWQRPASDALMPALRIPFVDRDGLPTDFARFKFHHPRTDHEGKPVKYEQPKGKPPRVFYTPSATGR